MNLFIWRKYKTVKFMKIKGPEGAPLKPNRTMPRQEEASIKEWVRTLEIQFMGSMQVQSVEFGFIKFLFVLGEASIIKYNHPV